MRRTLLRFVLLFSLVGTSPTAFAQTASPTAPGRPAVLYADDFPGRDIAEKVRAAFASQAGTAAAVRPGAVVELNPNRVYVYSSGSIELPNAASFPYIYAPVLDCHGARLEFRGTGTNVPAVLVHGAAANNSAVATTLRNCVILNAGTGGGAGVYNHGRSGFVMEGVSIEGGNNQYEVGLSTRDGGVPFVEQSYLHNVAFINPAQRAIYVHNADATGNGGYQYNFGYKLRFQMDITGSKEFAFEGVNAFNNHYEMTSNVGAPGGIYGVFAPPGSVVQSTYIEWNGENEGGPTRIGGGGLISLQCVDISRMGKTFEPLASCTVPLSSDSKGDVGFHVYNGENQFGGGARAGLVSSNGDYWMQRFASNAGVEPDSSAQWKVCATSPATPHVNESATCRNLLYMNPAYNDRSGLLIGDQTKQYPRAAAPLHVNTAETASSFPEALTAPDLAVGATVCKQIGMAAQGRNDYLICYAHNAADGSTDTLNFYRWGTSLPVVSLTANTVRVPALAGPGCAVLAVKPDGTLYRSATATPCP